MRIIGGRHRGRRLKGPTSAATRPTSDAVRESVFNVLAHQDHFDLEGSTILDLYAGTGALGIEALSRGAAHVVFVDSDPAAMATMRANVDQLDEGERVTVLKIDVLRLPRTERPADLVFLDPPYGLPGAVENAVSSAVKAGWVVPKTLFVIEVAAKSEVAWQEMFRVQWDRTYGQTRIVLATLAEKVL